jgi:tetratricopeptide (TPR) repeat protein
MSLPHPRVLLVACAVSAWAALPAAAQSPPVTPPDPAAALTLAFNQAMTAFQKGDYATASSNLEEVISKAPVGSQLEPVYFTLGAAYFDMGQYSRAADTLKTYIEKFPQSARVVDADYSLGQAYYLSKDFPNAASAFGQLENVPRYREQALLYEGMSRKQADDIPGAVATLERLTSPDIDTPIKVNGAMVLSGLYGDEKKPEQAQALLDKVFEKSDMVDDLVRLNALAASMGDHFLAEQNGAEAIATYRHIRSRDEVIQFQAAKLAALQGQFAENVAEMKSSPAQAAAIMADNNFITANIVKAKGLYDQATKLSDFTPALLLREGRAWYYLDAKWESIVVFNRLLQRYPQAAKERESALYSILTAYADVNQPERSREYCEQYLKEFPSGRNAETVAYMLGITALQANDNEHADTYFGRALAQKPNGSYREIEELMLGNAKFGEGKLDEAVDQYKAYLNDFPAGQYKEEATYRIGMALVFDGKYEDAEKSIGDYLQQYPDGTFKADAKYRLMLCKYAAQQYDQVIADATAWQQENPKDDLTGEVLSLKADAFASTGKIEESIPVYIESYQRAKTDQVVNYSLGEAAKNMQKLGKWDDISSLFEDFAKQNPANPSVLAAMWIGKADSHLGKTEEAKEFLVSQLKQYIADPKQETVEQLLQQLAQLCLHRPRVAAAPVPDASGTSSVTSGTAPLAAQSPEASPQPSATPVPYDAMAALDKVIEPLRQNANATANARLIYTHAELASMLRKHDVHDRLIGEIAAQFKPADLSPLLLAQAGDSLLASGSSDKAAYYYNELKEFFPNSVYLDYAYVGLGEIAFDKKDYDEALRLFTYATDKIAGSRIKDATVGEAKTLLEQGKYDDARKLFEQVASVREWRGESTAFAVYSIGDIEARQGHWAEAIAYFQRVFVLYQRYLPWVAKSYIGSAKSFDKLGKRDEAIAHLHEMLKNEKLQNMPEANEARQMLSDWGAPA